MTQPWRLSLLQVSTKLDLKRMTVFKKQYIGIILSFTDKVKLTTFPSNELSHNSLQVSNADLTSRIEAKYWLTYQCLAAGCTSRFPVLWQAFTLLRLSTFQGHVSMNIILVKVCNGEVTLWWTIQGIELEIFEAYSIITLLNSKSPVEYITYPFT